MLPSETALWSLKLTNDKRVYMNWYVLLQICYTVLKTLQKKKKRAQTLIKNDVSEERIRSPIQLGRVAKCLAKNGSSLSPFLYCRGKGGWLTYVAGWLIAIFSLAISTTWLKPLLLKHLHIVHIWQPKLATLYNFSDQKQNCNFENVTFFIFPTFCISSLKFFKRVNWNYTRIFN